MVRSARSTHLSDVLKSNCCNHNCMYFHLPKSWVDLADRPNLPATPEMPRIFGLVGVVCPNLQLLEKELARRPSREGKKRKGSVGAGESKNKKRKRGSERNTDIK